jgi:hypothetical protein
MANLPAEKRIVRLAGNATCAVGGGLTALYTDTIWGALLSLVVCVVGIGALQALWLYWRFGFDGILDPDGKKQTVGNAHADANETGR